MEALPRVSWVDRGSDVVRRLARLGGTNDVIEKILDTAEALAFAEAKRLGVEFSPAMAAEARKAISGNVEFTPAMVAWAAQALINEKKGE